MKVQFIHDTSADTPEHIHAYVHCGKCLDEKPADVSPRDWSRLQIGWTTEGFQVVCTRHNCNVTDVRVVPAPRITEAFRALVALHDDSVFICGQDDEQKVRAALAKARAAIA